MEGRNRKLNRWQGYDYSQSGLYFVTINTWNRVEWFGRVENEKMILNEYGKIARNCWLDLPNHYYNCLLDEFVIMPNHIHGIVAIDNARRRERSVTVPPAERPVTQNDVIAPTNPPGADRNGLKPFPTGNRNDTNHRLSEIVRGFKTFSSKYINKIQSQYITDRFHWQKSFHDRVIRDDDELNRIRIYITNNSSQWQFDRNNLKPGTGVAI